MSGPSSSSTIFLDAQVLRFAVFEKPAMTKQTVRWGDLTITQDVAGVPVPSRTRREGNEALLQYEIDCIPKLAELTRLGRFEPYINTEVDFEIAWLDLGALINTELSFFHGITLRKVPDPFPYGRIVASSHHTVKELDELRQHIFATDFDERFNEIKQAAGGNKNADAFHILSAERAGLEYFVTVDKKLINSLRHQRRVQLSVKVVYPSELLHQACDWPLNPALHQPAGAR
jgi:hypothetical protein